MSEAVDYLKWLIEEGRLNFGGQITVDGISLVDDEVDPEPASANVFGFYGEPDANGCRPNEMIDKFIAGYINSGDPFKIEAARKFSGLVYFLDDESDYVGDNKEMLLKNHQEALKRGHGNNRIMPLIDKNGAPVKNRWFIHFGNYNIPGWDTPEARLDQVRLIPQFLAFFLDDQVRIAKYGSLKERYGRG